MKALAGLFAVAFMVAALSLPALAQEAAPAPRVIHNGNTDIVFEGASTANLNIDLYRSFDRFAGEHRDLAESLSKKPSLVNNQKFVGDHPELAQFMSQHPEWRSDFEANPGNYLPLAPGVERATMESRNVYPD
jgi:hypothetical protein